MNTSRWIGLIALGLAIAGCEQPAANQSANQSTPTVAVVVSPPASPAAAPAAQSPTGSNAVPPAPSVLPVPDLIPPTSASARVPQIQTGRSNPYANVATTPRVTVSPAASPRASTPTVAVQPATVPPAAARPATARSTPASAPSTHSSPAAVRPAAAPTPQATPTRPTAELARSIAVSGVVQTSGRTSAIVQVPQEGSRYVSVGDRLAGGRVLVRRIEADAEEAIVVFEQDGVEVSRSIGTGAP